MEKAGRRGVKQVRLRLLGPDFKPGGRIPLEFTKDGSDDSPPLSWSDLPEGARSVAILADDPDAPREEPWVHWVIYNIPVMVRGLPLTGLPRGLKKTPRLAEVEGALQGMNDFGEVGYGGPQPPRGHGTHRYRFTLYALDDLLPTREGMTKADLLRAMEGHVLAAAEAAGTYSR